MKSKPLYEWLGIDPSNSHALLFDQPDYEGVLQQIQYDVVLCKVLVGVHDGASLVAQKCSLSSTELRIVCALAFFRLLQSLQPGEKCFFGNDFVNSLGLRKETPNGTAVTSRALEVVAEIMLAATKASVESRMTVDEWVFQTCIHDEKRASGAVRFVLVRSDASARNKQRAEFSAVYGLDQEQLDYVIDHEGDVGALLVSCERPDIAKQILHACSCHAVGRLPSLQVAGWGKDGGLKKERL